MSLLPLAVLLARRRLRADTGLALATALLVALCAALAAAVPAELRRSLDAGARAELASAPALVSASEQLVRHDEPAGSDVTTVTYAGSRVDSRVALLRHLPPRLARVAGPVTGTAVSVAFDGRTGTRALGTVRVAYGAGALAGARWVTGRGPARDDAPRGSGTVPVALSVGVARGLGLAVGDRVRLTRPGASEQAELLVTGTFIPADATAPVWSRLPGALAPAGAAVALLSGSSTTAALAALPGTGLQASYAVAPAPGRLTAAGVPALRAAAARWAVRPDLALSGVDDPPVLHDDVEGPLARAVAAQRAATALVSLLVAALLGVGGLVVLLVGRLLAARRGAALHLQVARGASLRQAALLALVEALPLVVGAAALGGLAALAVGPAYPVVPVLLVGVAAALAAVAAVVTTVLRRPPAGAARVVLEALVVVLATAALVATRGRGASAADGLDVLLVATPLLLVGAVTVVLLRCYPLLLRGLARGAARLRGAVALVGVTRARTSAAATPLPLLVLTLAVALGVGDVLLASGLASASATAARERVGAAARATTGTSAQATRLAAAVHRRAPRASVTAVAVVAGADLDIRQDYSGVTVLAVDPSSYAAVLRASAEPGAGALATLGRRRDPVDLLLTGGVLLRARGAHVALVLAKDRLPARVAGRAPADPRAWLPGEVVLADAAALPPAVVAQASGLVLAGGPGAEEALAAQAAPGVQVVTRSSWRDGDPARRLLAGVTRLLRAGSIALLVLAGAALLLVVVATARGRGAELAVARALGLRAGQLRATGAVELVPPVLVAGVVGAACGAALPRLLDPVLDPLPLTGGAFAPAPADPLATAVAALGALLGLLVLALLVDGSLRRRVPRTPLEAL
ncbi:putative ABC transport system permease protein [Motilibacter rhizosphaerae]|uniref:Putative ABC transport system permease protein n=1 Tax=Motilibacter rhizosphaerae TaxID=598652 RepID=A0A4Q7NV19_9ACTN|nr:FtsX-like permease family protein [Motilibacter rhizosphaerae]RZS91071.1 putative ABC transport system permease protein [Motilibacter rhizosphaerae]